MVLLLAQDSIPVAVDILEEEDSLAAVHIPVVEEGIPVEDIPVVVHNLVEEGNLAAADILVMGILLQAVRLAVPGCSCVSPPILTLVSYLQESCDWHEFHRQ